MMSTRQFENNAQRLPELRASAQKYKKPSRPEPEYLIDTSALGRAFPDFSQGGNTSDDGDISVEIGRGAKDQLHGNGGLQQLDEFSSSFNINQSDHSLTFNQPKAKTNQYDQYHPRERQGLEEGINNVLLDVNKNASQQTRASGLRNQLVHSPPTKLQDLGSGESRKSSSGSRRTLSAMHARARDEFERSSFSDERPPSVDLTVRNTRFSHGKHGDNVLEGSMPTKFSSAHGLNLRKNEREAKRNVEDTPKSTRDSLMLPTMPNMSELVSGVFEDGTPVFGRHRKSRTAQNKQKPALADVDEVPVPLDEQAIFLSLKLLQDKVALLERQKAEAQVGFKELQDRNRQLEAENQQTRRSTHRNDSALGTTDSEGGDEMVAGHQRGRNVKNNRRNWSYPDMVIAKPSEGLDNNMRGPQKELDASNRRYSTAETIIHSVTQERDSAVSQLGVAYITIESLKTENASLRAKTQELEQCLPSYDGKSESAGRQRYEQGPPVQQRSAHRKGTAKTSLGSQEVKTGHRQQSEITKNRNVREATNQGITLQDNKVAISDDEELFDLSAKPTRGLPNVRIQPTASHQETTTADRPTSSYGKADAYSQKYESAPVTTEVNGDTSRNLTYLSFIDTRDIEKLRKTIEQERLAQKQLKASRADILQEYAEPRPREPSERRTALDAGMTQKSSLEFLSGKSDGGTKKVSEHNDDHTNLEHNRRHSESSILSTKSRRRSNKHENMTSAFIIPDITMRSINENRKVTDQKDSMSVPKPTPVSELVSKDAAEEVGDTTMRPSQAPGLALATVIKGMEDEIINLKVQLESYQKLYNSHNPALSKRKRKYVFQKMQTVMRTIDAKSDQLYSLYDVLEGQKQSGQEMTEEQVEITLQSVGIDANRGTLGQDDTHKGANPREGRQPWDLSSNDGSDDELPWEGIEITGNTTKSTSRRTHERRGSRF